MSTPIDLVFRGDVLPGFDDTLARTQLLALLKLEPSHETRLFSGQRVVLKRLGSMHEGERYRKHLASIGIHTRLEEKAPVASTPVASTPVASTPVASTPVASTPVASASVASALPQMALVTDAAAPPPAATAETVVCPHCGETQPKRNLCRACGTDMPRMRAAQESTRKEALEPTLAKEKVYVGVYEGLPPPSMFGWGLEGRIGRGRYIVACLTYTALAWLVVALIARSGHLWPAVLFLPLAYQGARLAVLRCHDLGWSGKLSLISAIPVVGWLFSLALTFFPGQDMTNEHGMPDEPVHQALRFGVGIACFLCASLARTSFDHTPLPGQHFASVSADSADTEQALLAAYDPDDRITLYVQDDCDECSAREAQFDRLGLDYRLVHTDGDRFDADAYASLAEEAEASPDELLFPLVRVNGLLLVSPMTEEITSALE